VRRLPVIGNPFHFHAIASLDKLITIKHRLQEGMTYVAQKKNEASYWHDRLIFQFDVLD